MLHFFIGAFYAITIFFASVAFSSTDHSDYEKAQDIRLLVRKLILYSAKDPKDVPQHLKNLIFEQQAVVVGLLNTQDMNKIEKIIQTADLPFDTHAILADLLTMAQGQTALGGDVNPSIFDYNQLWQMMDENAKLNAINSIPNDKYQMFAKKLLSKIDQIDFANDTGIKSLNDPEQGLNVSNLPKAFIDLYNILIDQYFGRFMINDKIAIITEILELPLPSDNILKLSVFVQHSGPVLQKFFQLMGNNVHSPQLRKVLNDLKSNVKPVPFHQIKKSIEKTYSLPMDQIFENFDEKPLAAATIAQAHLAKLKGSDKTIVVKVRRPGIKEKAKRELKIIKSLSKEPGILAVIANMEESIEEELDFRNEGRYLRQGRVYNNKKRGVYATAINKTFPLTENVLMMDRAAGSKIDKEMNGDELVYKAKGLQQLYRGWLSTALFDSGFFHADLHAGNLFYLRTFDKIGYKLTLIDFGSVGTLTFAERKSLIKFSFGVYTEQVELIIAAFKEFQTLSDETKHIFIEKIQEILHKDLSNGEKTTLILNEVIAREFKLSKNFLQFIRGKSFLEDHIHRNNLKLAELNLDKFATPATKIYTDVLIGKVPLIFRSYVFSKDKTKDPLIDKTVFKFLWKYLSMRYIFPKAEAE